MTLVTGAAGRPFTAAPGQVVHCRGPRPEFRDKSCAVATPCAHTPIRAIVAFCPRLSKEGLSNTARSIFLLWQPGRFSVFYGQTSSPLFGSGSRQRTSHAIATPAKCEVPRYGTVTGCTETEGFVRAITGQGGRLAVQTTRLCPLVCEIVVLN